MLRSLAAVVLLLSGCDLYFGGDDQPPPPCAYGANGGGAPADVAQGLRDPYTGQCEYYGGGGYCDGTCGPCPDYDQPAQPYDWASCYSQCESLDEGSCTETSGCYAAYLGDAANHSFLGCFATAPSGPIQGSCANLDAYACSRHDNCSALYSGMGSQHFIQCMPEADSCNCGTGYHCAKQCDANTMCQQVCVSDLTCASVDCMPGSTCTQVCTNGVCGPTCVTDPAACSTLTTESACVSRNDCTPVYEGTDCTCTLSGCQCNVLTFERCQAL